MPVLDTSTSVNTLLIASTRATAAPPVSPSIFEARESAVRLAFSCERQKINRLHAHGSRTHDSRTTHSHEHRASNCATTLNSRSRRRRPQDRRCPFRIHMELEVDALGSVHISHAIFLFSMLEARESAVRLAFSCEHEYTGNLAFARYYEYECQY